jgi:hypothetical protein
MQLKKMLVYSLCAISIGAWYKEAKSCCPPADGYGYSSWNSNYTLSPSEYCPSDKRWRPEPKNEYIAEPKIDLKEKPQIKVKKVLHKEGVVRLENYVTINSSLFSVVALMLLKRT